MTQQIATVDVKVIDGQLDDVQNSAIAEVIGWGYDPDTGWTNLLGEAAKEINAGYVAFSHGVKYAFLTSDAMRSGWMEASGYHAYCLDMERDEVDQQRNGWQL